MRYRFSEWLLVALVGGVGYYTLEVLWRGWSHISMALTGAICFLIYYRLCAVSRLPLLTRALLGAAVITLAELCAGLIVNRWLGLGVWDYSSLPLNLWGQIALPYSLLWFALCLPAALLCRLLRRGVFGAEE